MIVLAELVISRMYMGRFKEAQERAKEISIGESFEFENHVFFKIAEDCVDVTKRNQSMFITRVKVLPDAHGGTLMITHIDGENAVNEKFNGMVNAFVFVSDWVEDFNDGDKWDIEGVLAKIVTDIKAYAKENGYVSARDFLTAMYAEAVFANG